MEPIGATYDIPGKENRHLPEGRVITLEYEKFYLIATYIPNASQGLVRLEYRLNTWDVDFQEYTESLRANGKSVYIYILYIYNIGSDMWRFKCVSPRD